MTAARKLSTLAVQYSMLSQAQTKEYLMVSLEESDVGPQTKQRPSFDLAHMQARSKEERCRCLPEY
jgi:hypothetical protein